MCDSISLMSSAMSAQTADIQMACQAMAMQRVEGAIALELLEGVTQTLPQDPSTITPEQLKSPIDLRV